MARYRHTEGKSWRAGPGVRRWRSDSISVGAGWYLVGWLLLYGILWPFFIAPLWLVAELFILWVTAILVCIWMIARDQPFSDVYVARVGPFWLLDLRLHE